MVGVRLSLPSLCSLLIRGAVLALLAVVAVMTAGQRAHAVSGFTFNGVTCMDVHLASPPTEANRAVIILSRIEPAGGNTFNITSHSYTGPGGLIPTKPTADPCALQINDGNSLLPTVPPDPPDLSDRPTSVATFTAGTLAWEKCQFEPDLLTGTSVLSKFTLVVPAPGKTLTTNSGVLIAYLDTRGSVATPFCTTSPDITTFTTVLVSSLRVKTTGVPSPSLRDDWDGDNISDWNELGNPPPSSCTSDPFNPSCAVGGIAGLPDVSDAARAAARPSGTDATQVATIAGAIIAGAAVFGGAAWCVRRRRVP